MTEKAPIDRLGNRGAQKIIKNVFCHLLRHTMATQAINSNVSLFSLQMMLGHNSANTTLIYARVNDEQIKQEYKKIS